MPSRDERGGYLLKAAMFEPLHNRTYRHLFLAQVIALVGTGLLTVALGLLAYELAGGDAGQVLGTALAIKMIAYVGVAPIAGAIAGMLPRRAYLAPHSRPFIRPHGNADRSGRLDPAAACRRFSPVALEESAAWYDPRIMTRSGGAICGGCYAVRPSPPPIRA